jgi:uncharacterized protein YbjT (DUF2867 family)
MTSTNTLTVLVTGATGKQGSAVARALLKRGHRVRAMTRKVDSEPAQGLRQGGAAVIRGDFDDSESLLLAMRDVDAVFAMGSPLDGGPTKETEQGCRLIDVAREVNIGHLVYSSVASADQHTGIPHFESKAAVERYLDRADVPYTIVGPVFFMENFSSPWLLDGLRAGKLSMALPARRTLQQVALADLAQFVVHVLERRNTFLAKRIDIASEALSPEMACALISKVVGREIRYVETPVVKLEKSNKDYAAMFRWFDRVGYSVDVARLQEQYQSLDWHTFESWVSVQDWAALERLRSPGMNR